MRITDPAKIASAKGFANESRLLAALLERGYNASRIDLPHSTYDIVVEKEGSTMIRLQVKTLSRSNTVAFTGGTRGGVDRSYKTHVKEYIQNTTTSDAVVAVDSRQSNGDEQIDFYFIPTLYIETLKQKSLSVNKIPQTKNNWELLEQCQDKSYVLKVMQSKK